MRGGANTKMRTITKLRRSTRGLSPIFATLILIAIAVIAGIIVYMYTSGTLASMMGGGTAGQEKVAIQAVNPQSDTQLVFYAQSTGGGNVVIDSVIIKFAGNSSVAVVYTAAVTNPDIITADLTAVTITTSATDMALNENYVLTVVSESGGSFVSSSFKGI